MQPLDWGIWTSPQSNNGFTYFVRKQSRGIAYTMYINSQCKMWLCKILKIEIHLGVFTDF